MTNHLKKINKVESVGSLRNVKLNLLKIRLLNF